MLVKDIGRVAGTYPANGIRLRVVTRHDRFAAIPVGDDDLCADSMWLTVDDIQLWHFDPEKLAAHRAKYAQSPPLTTTKPVAKVIGGFTAIILPDHSIMTLSKKYKRRAFLRAVDEWCKANNTDTFLAQEVIESLNSSLRNTVNEHKMIQTDRVLDDLFKGQKDEFLQLFEILDLAAAHFRLKVTFQHHKD